ncbi:lactate dehydrogenase [Aliidongia dinghuensis]|uniref:Lactate dehydrogenase n=1 Tax=Aliidongia dinghuensis TaxID=1867774 RepID=A0A8J3E650_9PROT|nr:Ldh family oxidoreductase [Aliidongia dinghuensis]GGF41226.1 lactate dehydrogenase [Aliidongia dinghuensis]
MSPADVFTGPRVAADRLSAFATAAYVAVGMPPEDAGLAADTLVQADLWGHQSHGVMRLPWYVARLKAGTARPVAAPEQIVDMGAVGVVDGCDGMGQVVTARAARDAIRRAKAHGIGAVAVRNSNHFGTAMYYTLMAPPEGCILFLATNASPAMAPWGGRAKRVGNNPWSWAAPAGRHAPLVLDIANTAVARGKIYLARQRGTRIPEGWAVDARGTPTTDPEAALAGIIQPMAGHKGYGISVVMDMLAGVLTGSAYGPGVNGPYQAEKRSGAGHLLLALNIEVFQPRADFEARMEAMIDGLKGAPRADGVDEIFYPGEIEARADIANRRDGLLLPADTVADLRKLARELGIEPDGLPA